MSLKGAIFDLDGVVVNTVPLHFKAWKKMFSEFQRDFTFDEYAEKVDGIPRSDGTRAVLRNLSLDKLEEAASKKQTYFLEFLEAEGVRVYASTIDFIGKLKENNIKVAVISSSKNCLHILRKVRLDTLFDIIITGNDINRGKPDPEIYLLACERLEIQRQECVVFEDSNLGVRAAKSGSLKCIGVNRYADPQRLKGADITIGDLEELDTKTIEGLFL